MDVLHDWIKEKRYLRAINVRVDKPKVEGLDDRNAYVARSSINDERHVVLRTRSTYICPRGLGVHQGNPDACGHRCRKVQGDDEPEYIDETYIEVVTIRTEVVFDDSVCQI